LPAIVSVKLGCKFTASRLEIDPELQPRQLARNRERAARRVLSKSISSSQETNSTRAAAGA